MLKDRLKNIINYFGYDIRKIDKNIKRLSFDDILNLKTEIKNPIIFDVGANIGQSIERFKNIFPVSSIHSFEPGISEFLQLKEKYNNATDIFLNNIGIGEKITKRDFYCAAKSETSSFIKISKNTSWIKSRSKEFNTSVQNYSKKVPKISIDTIDNYCKNNSIKFIDILKIDTQGYEVNVLEGAKNTLKKKKISIIETELILDDVYEKHATFFQIEKYLIPNNYRLVAVKPMNYNNFFEGNIFVVDLIYILNQ